MLASSSSGISLNSRPISVSIACRRVALLVHTASDWIRQILRGIAMFAHESGEWDFQIELRGLYERLALPKGWHGDGVILRLTHPGLRTRS